jgi:hypothetical protein
METRAHDRTPGDRDVPPADGNNPGDKATFATVLDRELSQIDTRRHRLGLGPAPARSAAAAQEPVLKRARDRRMVGLALSGGGIRSATFNLGLLQGLARLKLLELVDYLSTVSGGGYIGGWLAAWIQRAAQRGEDLRCV